MSKLTREFLVQRMFSDAKNYPYGFSRSGDFSISESKALSEYGCLIAALVDGQIQPETNEDNELLAAAFGKKEPESAAEKAWVKYQKRINRPKLGSVYGNHRPVVVEDDIEDDETIEDDLEVEMDD
ncbi:DUF413 domain-containing protein [Paraglaciecola arctica]|uniref:Macrodomain Ori protein n=1 Tax=Paraglaciecola arctica BSs20135 TaxID=493475 RepID=K6YQ16_9ALTE|nr:DUF413 domain-containing protein [Paraglaciecola arctica]GAC20267.1 hypothetical protein GARC_3309 [Paraglaciecola arctica BSs20135]